MVRLQRVVIDFRPREEANRLRGRSDFEGLQQEERTKATRSSPSLQAGLLAARESGEDECYARC